MFFILVLAPYSAHPATIIAKIIPNTIITFILSLYLFDYLPRLIFLLTFTTSAKRAATTANVIPNTIIIVILSLLYYSLFIFSSAKVMPFCVRTQYFWKKLQKRADFLIFIKFCHRKQGKMTCQSSFSPIFRTQV